jgi:hypothetical protein
MKPIIEITVTPDGAISINAVNFTGTDCEQATKHLEAELGVVTKKVKKTEYHQQAKTNNQQRIGQ